MELEINLPMEDREWMGQTDFQPFIKHGSGWGMEIVLTHRCL